MRLGRVLLPALLLLIFLFAALTFVACGSSSSNKNDNPQPTSSNPNPGTTSSSGSTGSGTGSGTTTGGTTTGGTTTGGTAGGTSGGTGSSSGGSGTSGGTTGSSTGGGTTGGSSIVAHVYGGTDTKIAEFELSSDGHLNPGFTIAATARYMAPAGKFLATAQGNQLTLYIVGNDGSLQLTSSTNISSGATVSSIDGTASFLFAAAGDGIHAYSTEGSTFKEVIGSPFTTNSPPYVARNCATYGEYLICYEQYTTSCHGCSVDRITSYHINNNGTLTLTDPGVAGSVSGAFVLSPDERFVYYLTRIDPINGGSPAVNIVPFDPQTGKHSGQSFACQSCGIVHPLITTDQWLFAKGPESEGLTRFLRDSITGSLTTSAHNSIGGIPLAATQHRFLLTYANNFLRIFDINDINSPLDVQPIQGVTQEKPSVAIFTK